MKNYSTFSRSALQPPHEEIRIDVPKHNPWFLFLDSHSEILKVYQLAVNHILSDISPIHLDELRSILKFEYAISYEIIEDFIQFIIQVPTKHIEFETTKDTKIRLPLIYKKPRQQVSIVGQYCVWVNNENMAVQTPKDLKR